MSHRDGLHPDDIEQRLAARIGRVPPAGHRDRVLAAVRDTLTGRIVSAANPAGLDVAGTAALVTLALSALLAVVAPWLVVARLMAPLSTKPRIVVQARAAGIDFPMELATVTVEPGVTPVARRNGRSPGQLPDAWRLRTLLTGEL